MLAIENHQDFGSDELVAFCEATRGVGICFDTGNTFPVAEAPLDFTAPHRAPCAPTSISRTIASSSPKRAIASSAARSATARFRCPRCWANSRAITRAGRGPGAGRARGATRALPEARMVDVLSRRRPHSRWRPVSRRRASIALQTTPTARTPWERGDDAAIEAYELAMIRRSTDNMRAIGLSPN